MAQAVPSHCSASVEDGKPLRLADHDPTASQSGETHDTPWRSTTPKPCGSLARCRVHDVPSQPSTNALVRPWKSAHVPTEVHDVALMQDTPLSTFSSFCPGLYCGWNVQAVLFQPKPNTFWTTSPNT